MLGRGITMHIFWQWQIRSISFKIMCVAYVDKLYHVGICQGPDTGSHPTGKYEVTGNKIP